MYGAMIALAFVDESRRYPEMKPTSGTDVVAESGDTGEVR
jgi:hypothetical protein